jgi:hypothetical protein
MDPFDPDTDNFERNTVFDSDLHKTYVGFLLQPSWFYRELPERPEKKAPYLAILRAAFSRLQQLINDPEQFNPRYARHENRRDYPKICETFWNGPTWIVPTTAGPIELTGRVPHGRVGYTQAFRFTNANNYEPWGPPIPYGEYTKGGLKEMLTIEQP